jgi:hypothetical protein
LDSAAPQISAPATIRVTRSPVPPSPKPTPAQVPAETAAAPEPVPVAPQLGQIYTPAEIRENSRMLDAYLDQLRRAVTTFSSKNLNREDRLTADLVKNWLAQAEQLREKDLVTAVSLAKRADSLAKDLLSRLP